MANDITINPATVVGGPVLDTLEIDGAHRELIVLAGELSAQIAAILNAAPSSTDYGLVTRNIPSGTQTVTSTFLSNQAGTWDYYAGTSGTVNVAAGERVLSIAAHATTAATLTIDGGDSIPIPAATQINLVPMGNLVAPTLVFTGTDSYMVEVVS
jgi:hypothetical protein